MVRTSSHFAFWHTFRESPSCGHQELTNQQGDFDMNRLGMLGLLVALGIGAIGVPSANAGGHGYGAYGYDQGYSSYSGYRYNNGGHSFYHVPSVHTDYVPHNRLHFSPWRGVHIDRHYDAIPHYTPGHFDRFHQGHIDSNPWYHH